VQTLESGVLSPGHSVLPAIAPLAPTVTDRPLLSVMIPCYNYAEYMRSTLKSVLCQDPGASVMQIEVVDDCSTIGDSAAVTQEIGRGRIGFHRQPRNLGMVDNFNDCIRRARGEWVQILHSDDVVRPGFYERACQAIRQHPEIGAWACRVIYMDPDGHWTGLSELEARTPQVMGKDFASQLLVEPRLYFVGLIVRRSVYEQVGGFRPDLKLCYDWDMWKRAALHAPIFYDPEPLACYRMHPVSAYASWVRTGESVADERRSIQVACDYLPPAEAARVRRDALKAAAVRASRTAHRQWRLGHRAAALRVSREALRCSAAPSVVARLLLNIPLAIGRRPAAGRLVRSKPAKSALSA
jgi:hypothetical protein